MMGHGKHHNCAMCGMAKSVGMMEKCTDKYCTDPSHQEEKEEHARESHGQGKHDQEYGHGHDHVHG